MIRWIQNFIRSSPAICIFLIAFILRGGYFLLVMKLHPEGIYTPDSSEYWALAENLRLYGVFTQSNSYPVYLEHMRTPGYPVFLMLIQSLFLGPWLIVLIQTILSSITCVLVYRLSLLSGLSILSSFIASALLMVDLPSIMYSSYVLTETLFTFVFVAGVYMLFISVINRKPSQIFLAGGLIGLSVLVRPVSVYTCFIFLGFIGYTYRNQVRLLVRYIFLWTIGFMVILSPWVVRNYLSFDRIFISTAQAHIMAVWHAPQIKSKADDIPFGNARYKLGHDWYYGYPGDPYRTPIHYMDYVGGKTREVLWSYPVISIKEHIVNVAYLLFKPANSDLHHQLSYNKNMSLLSGRYDILTVIIILLQFVVLCVLYVGLIYGSYILVIDRNIQLIFILFLILYFINMVVPPITYCRFRVPAMPLLSIISGLGIKNLIDKVTGRV